MSEKAVTPEKLAAEEAEILDPDRGIHLRDGRRIMVREIRYGAARRLGSVIRPFVEAFAVEAVKFNPKDFLKRLLQLPEDHPDAYALCLEASTGISVKDQEDLSDEDGALLEIAFWRVNRGFFARKVARYLPENLAAVGELAGVDLRDLVAEAARAAVSTQGSSSPTSLRSVTTPRG